MKKFWLTFGALCLSVNSNVALAENDVPQYGDLYNVQWCPCNPEEPYNADGSVVLGKTVMCPCDGLYSGYKKGFEEDMRDLKKATQKQLRKLNYFKYYIGMDYNLAQQKAASTQYSFDDIRFANGPIQVTPDHIIDDQDSLSFVLGARLSKYFGLEGFYESSYKDNNFSELDYSTLNADPSGHYLMNEYTTSYSAWGLDLIGYLPVSAYFDFVGSVGVSRYDFENKVTFAVFQNDAAYEIETVNSDFNEKEWGWRFAAGGQLNIAEGVALRAMYRYVSIKSNFIDEITEYSLGVRFLF